MHLLCFILCMHLAFCESALLHGMFLMQILNLKLEKAIHTSLTAPTQ